MNATMLSETERDFVASCLADPGQFQLVHDILPDMISDPVMKAIWRVAYRYQANIAAIPLYEELKNFPEGQQAYQEFPDVIAFRTFYARGTRVGAASSLADTLRQEIIAREVDQIVTQRDPNLVPSDQALAMSRRLAAVGSRAAPVTSKSTLMESVDRMVSRWEWRQKNPTLLPGWRTGEDQYDRFLSNTGGLDGGKLVVIGALTGMGKSHWLIQQAIRLSTTPRDDNKRLPKVAFFSMEMSTDDVSARVLAHFANVEISKTVTQPDAAQRITAARQIIMQLNQEERLQVYYGISSLDGIQRKIHQLVANGACDIAVIDYIGMIQAPTNRSSSYQQVGDVVKALQTLALNLGIPIITASQLNRSTYEATAIKPSLTNIAESSVVTQCADIVQLLWRPDQACKNLVGKNLGLWKDIVVVLTEKTRSGGHQKPMYYHLNPAFSKFTPVPPEMVKRLESEEQQSLLETFR